MNSSDLRLVRLIPVTGEGSFSRASDATYFDAAGVLQTAPPNTLRVTYDPADLSKAPYALTEPEAVNRVRNNTMAGAVLNSPALPTNWNPATNVPNMQRQVVGLGKEDGIDYVDIRIYGAVPALALPEYTIAFDSPGAIATATSDVWMSSVYARIISGDTFVQEFEQYFLVYNSTPAMIEAPSRRSPRWTGSLRENRLTQTFRIAHPDAASIIPRLDINLKNGGDYYADVVVRIGLPQMERDRVTSPIKTSGVAVTRAADVVGPGAGLLYSNVPITEPLWAAGTYALGAKVRDAQNFVFESLAAGNTAALTDKTKWLPLGVTNRWRVFDKAVNSQTVAPGMLTFAVKPGAVATTLMLLNMEGASVTVSQSDSGYIRTQSLVSHEVDNWYDFYYEEPVRAGDAVFTDIPPYPNSMLTVAIDNGPLESKIGACLVGKPLVLGKVTASFSAGVLSYSTSTTDTFGNITMVKRSNAPRMNFDVMIPTGSEDFAYRTLRDITDTEIGIIVGDRFSMGIGYGFLGQWDVPKSGSGRTASIEFKGLV